MTILLHTKHWLLLILLAFSATGCGQSGYLKAKGKITQDGQPVRESLEVILYALEAPAGQETVYPAVYNKADGTFEVVGLDRLGVLPGKYRVTVQLNTGMGSGSDRFKGRYNRENSSFVHELTADNQFIEIELEGAENGSQ